MALISRITIAIVSFIALFSQYVTSSPAPNTPYAITGVTGFGIHPRLEIRDMIRHHPLQYNLYLLALRAFQAEDEKNKLSYFQIAGIHYLPSIPWDGVKPEAGAAKGAGYCVHGEEIFATWHRPYIALFEQRLQHLAMKIAKKFKGQKQEQYVEEAKKLRSAYWDWARPVGPNEDAFPKALANTHVSVETPNGHQSVPNPFYQYRFHPLPSDDFFSVFNHMPETVRYPKSDAGPSMAQSVEKQVVKSVSSSRSGWQSSLYRWFSNCPEYFQISGTPPPQNDSSAQSQCTDNLEAIHGSVHISVGGFNKYSGHMAIVPVAGFDPIFWLHHTNIDRLIAMWQAIYPSTWVYNTTIRFPNYVLKKGQQIDQDTDLKPFHRNSKGDFWTSRQVRDFRVFQYTYPEFLEGGDDPAGMRKLVNQLYAPENPKSSSDKRSQAHLNPSTKDARNSKSSPTLPTRNLLPKRLLSPFIASNSSSFEYLANIVTTKYKLGGSYAIYLFLGEPASSDPLAWVDDPNFAGTAGIFSAEGMEDSDAIYTSSISLTDALYKKVSGGLLSDLTEGIVVPYLAKSLQWKVVGSNGAQIDASDVPDLAISAYASTLAPLTDLTEFPEWSPLVPLPSVTNGKAGGG